MQNPFYIFGKPRDSAVRFIYRRYGIAFAQFVQSALFFAHRKRDRGKMTFILLQPLLIT